MLLMELLRQDQKSSMYFLNVTKKLTVFYNEVEILAFHSFSSWSSVDFLFTNERKFFSTAGIVPDPLVNCHSHTVVINILVA